MLHILLLILKILLWILLGILGLVLLIVLLVLFAPIHYRVGVKYDGKALVKAKVRFLFVSAGVEFSQEEKKLSKAIRIAGIKLGGNKAKAKPEKTSRNQREFTDGSSKTDENGKNDVALYGNLETETGKQGAYEKTVADDKTSKDFVDQLDEALNESHDESKKKVSDVAVKMESSTEKTDASDFAGKKTNDENSSDINKSDVNKSDMNKSENLEKKSEKNSDKNSDKNDKVPLTEKIKNIVARVKAVWVKLSPEYILDTIDKKEDDISKKYNRLEKKVKRYLKLWNMQSTVKTRNYLKVYLKTLVKHIGPRKIRGYVHYGFGDPAKTGQITGYISLLPFVYQKNFSLQPDFYDKVIEAEVDMKGHLMLGYILRIALKPYLWRTVKIARKVVAQNK